MLWNRKKEVEAFNVEQARTLAARALNERDDNIRVRWLESCIKQIKDRISCVPSANDAMICLSGAFDFEVPIVINEMEFRGFKVSEPVHYEGGHGQPGYHFTVSW